MLRPLAMAVVVTLLFASPSVVSGQARIVSEELDYAAFAAAVAPNLVEIEAAFQIHRAELENAATKGPVGAAEVEDLLNRVEGEVLRTLQPDELAPMRDSIRLRFERIRRQLEATSGEGGGFAFASFVTAPAAAQGLLRLQQIVPLFEAAAAVLRRLITHAQERGFSLHLCIVSRPDAGARFRLRPPGYPQGVKEGSTILFREVGRGHYAYLAEERKGKKRTIECGWEGGGDDRECLDLWETSGDQLYECDFARGDCTLHRLPGECPGS